MRLQIKIVLILLSLVLVVPESQARKTSTLSAPPRGSQKRIAGTSIVIRPMTRVTVKQASSLVARIWDNPSYGGDLANSFKGKPYQESGTHRLITSSTNWVAYDTSTRKVVGTVGLYTYKKDKKTSYWLDWFCVDPSTRGKGVGKALLQHAIDTTRASGKKFLRLYTSENPREAAAQGLYDKFQLKVYKREHNPDMDPYPSLYRRLRVN